MHAAVTPPFLSGDIPETLFIHRRFSSNIDTTEYVSALQEGAICFAIETIFYYKYTIHANSYDNTGSTPNMINAFTKFVRECQLFLP